MKAGYNFGETAELFPVHYRVPKARLAPGRYRNITGNEATALGFLAASKLTGLPLFYGSYPITPASDILQELARFKNFGVKTFQAEDEIAAIGSAIGASFGGALGLTGTSGPGLALKSEALGLAVMVELPLVVAVIQRSGPSTGMPTKTDQADLLQAMFGRNGECPVAIVAPATPTECFDMAIEAWRIAIRHMVPDDLPVGRLPRHRRRAVAGARHRRPGAHRGEVRDRPGDVQAIHPRRADARAAVGSPRDARGWSTASAVSRRRTSLAT